MLSTVCRTEKKTVERTELIDVSVQMSDVLTQPHANIVYTVHWGRAGGMELQCLHLFSIIQLG